jgi:phosphate transport system substrate-binding protein
LRLGNKESKLLFSRDTLLLPSSEGIIKETSQNRNAIGYDGLGYVTDEVKVIGVATKPGETYIFPSVETVNSGQYPIARELYMYTNGQPGGKLAEYMNWIYSDEAQKIVANLGFVPITKP